jgi:protocatechuate 3,4-dioxygenase, beta subunit
VIKILILYFIIICIASCKELHRQSKETVNTVNTNAVVGGPCEGCELYEAGMPKQINNEHTSIGWTEGKQKLIVKGKVLQVDGKTPAANIIVYYWHTNEMGLYTPDKNTPPQANLHGKLRGWIKTDENGNYTINTSKPGAYPSQHIPQHIHLAIKEPGINNAYYADLYFAADPLYTSHQKKYGKLNRAGDELLNTVKENNIEIAQHNILLGMNIPDYPMRK